MSGRLFPSHARFVVVSALAASGLFTAVGHASNPTPQQIKTAADEFDRGVKAAQAGNFDEAAQHFEAADREAPSPDALRASVRARRDAKQGARAATLAALALVRYPTTKEVADFARGVITQFSPGLHKLAVSCKPECVLVADNKLVPGEAAAEITLYLDPGKHAVSAGWGDKNQSKELAATAGGSSALTFTAPADKPVAPPPTASAAPVTSAAPTTTPTASAAPTETAPVEAPSSGGKGLSPAVTYVGLGVTAVLTGVTIWSGLDARSNPGTDVVRARCRGLGENCPEYRDGLSRQHRTNGLLGATIGVGVVTGVLAIFFTNWSGGSSSSDTKTTTDTARKLPTVLPALSFGDGGAQLHATGRF